MGSNSTLILICFIVGKFTDVQRCLYEIVLRIQRQCIELCVPGQTINKLYIYMLSLMGNELQNIGIIPKDCKNLMAVSFVLLNV